jgi:hypothetical protein
MKTYKDFIKGLKEDGGVSVGAGITGGASPTNVISGGNIAGAPPDSPPVNLKKRRKRKDFPGTSPATPVMGTVKRKAP